ncbi:hypothetical protein GQ600_3097 [Phytophthora cactorum]|nr:hypothetical protein GQ600_3097 [Phytophthora cactorum]
MTIGKKLCKSEVTKLLSRKMDASRLLSCSIAESWMHGNNLQRRRTVESRRGRLYSDGQHPATSRKHDGRCGTVATA